MNNKLLEIFELLDYLGEREITDLMLKRAKVIGDKLKVIPLTT